MDKNLTHAFVNALKTVRSKGVTVTTRGNEQVEVLSQLLRIENPRERVIVTPHRNNNIFSLVAETIWVLGGRNDLEYLSHYLPRAIEFSDDGLTWRAAYGPRLRNWDGVDQFKEVAALLKADPSSKRAVMSIFDPKNDYVETKDVPCNNWLHFLVRDGHLHLNVTVRANDAVWGFGGINSFEWSVLQEMMAFWTGSKVGILSWFVGSLHVYERHYEATNRIIGSAREKTLYDFGIVGPSFSTSIETFDTAMAEWFDIEKRIRDRELHRASLLIETVADDLLRNCLEVLLVYKKLVMGYSDADIQRSVEALPSNDIKISVVEYFHRRSRGAMQFSLNTQEAEFFRYYRQDKQQLTGALSPELADAS